MFKQFRVSTAILLACAFSTLYGCSKEEALQPDNASTLKTSSSPTVTSWDDFVNKVVSGQMNDPYGQYVSDGTFAEKGSIRPKIDGARRRFIPVFESGGVTAYSIDEPCAEVNCGDDPVGGGGGTTPPAVVFSSSEGVSPYSGADNPNGYIYDLKISKGNDPNQHNIHLDGYTVIAADLNKGAGGQHIYLTFTRNPSKVQLGIEDGRTDRTIKGPIRWLRSSASDGFFANGPGWNASTDAIPLQTPGPFGGDWKMPDLNDGAGGRYIYAYMGKTASYGPPIEVGVISGNNSSIQPPSGWTRQDRDLNEGAGGDYIYFCSKNR